MAFIYTFYGVNICQLIGLCCWECVLMPKCHTNFQFYRFDGFSVVSSAVYSSLGLSSFFNSIFLLTFHKSRIGVLITRKPKHNGKFSVKEVLSNGTLMPTVCQWQNDLQRLYVLCVCGLKVFLDCNLSWEYQLTTI